MNLNASNAFRKDFYSRVSSELNNHLA